jgi:hypothetical protein
MNPARGHPREIDPADVALTDRLAVVEAFFDRHPGPGRTGPGLGRAVLDFMRWEGESGRLADEGGSRWWRAVNGGLVADLAELSVEGPAGNGQARGEPGRRHRVAVAAWEAYAASGPDAAQAALWSAHQASLTAAVESAAALLDEECAPERSFAALVLAVVEDTARQVVATDTDALADVTRRWYPSTYPITAAELDALRRGLLPPRQDGSR